MIIAAHNAHLTQIQGPPTIVDPGLDCQNPGGTATVPSVTPSAPKWQGDCQALLRDQAVEEVRGNMRILLREVTVELPNTLPYEPVTNDLLTFTINTGEIQTFEVRLVDRQFWGLGRYRYICRQQ